MKRNTTLKPSLISFQFDSSCYSIFKNLLDNLENSLQIVTGSSHDDARELKQCAMKLAN